MAEAVVVLIVLTLGFVGVAAAAWWARSLWKRRRELSRGTKVVIVVVAVAAMYGALGTALGLVKAFGAVGGESVDPSQKARILGEGISEAMNCAALGLAVFLAGVVVLVFMTKKRSDRSK